MGIWDSIGDLRKEEIRNLRLLFFWDRIPRNRRRWSGEMGVQVIWKRGSERRSGRGSSQWGSERGSMGIREFEEKNYWIFRIFETFPEFHEGRRHPKLVLYCRKHNMETKTTRLISLDSSFSMLRVYSAYCKILTFDSPHSLHTVTITLLPFQNGLCLADPAGKVVVSSRGNSCRHCIPLNVWILAATRSEGLPGTSRDPRTSKFFQRLSFQLHCVILELNSWRSEEISFVNWGLAVWFLRSEEISSVWLLGSHCLVLGDLRRCRDGWTSLFESWDLGLSSTVVVRMNFTRWLLKNFNLKKFHASWFNLCVMLILSLLAEMVRGRKHTNAYNSFTVRF